MVNRYHPSNWIDWDAYGSAFVGPKCKKCNQYMGFGYCSAGQHPCKEDYKLNNENKHTDGEWVASATAKDGYYEVSSKGRFNGSGYSGAVLIGKARTKSDAQLFAAAPKMFAALVGIVESFNESVKTDEALEEFPCLKDCIEAIAKAKWRA